MMKRKEFIKTCGLTCMGGTAILTLLESCNPAYYAVASFEGNKLKVARSEFMHIRKEQTLERKFVLVEHVKLKFPVCLYRIGESEFVALYMECTHQGCELHAHDGSLTCPCHGSEFDIHGKVTNPPAEDPLRQFTVTLDQENIYISL
jgi:Rieske Fe-S protein